MKAILVLVGVLFLCGCGGYHYVHLAHPLLDSQAKLFAPAENQSNIYVVRSGGGVMVYCSVFLDGKSVHPLQPSQYRLLKVAPGNHAIGTDGDTVSLTTEAGKNYFLRLSFHGNQWLDLWPKCRLEIIGEQEGRNLVLQSRLAGELR
jgi:hypothetical protein